MEMVNYIMMFTVGGDCYHTILISDIQFNFNFIPIIGAMAIAPYGFYKKGHP